MSTSAPTATPRFPWLASSSGPEQFFELAKERYRIKLRRERREPAPWTDDDVLRSYRFCNVHREDDKTTQWFREHVRDPLAEDCRGVLLSTVVFRWFNRIEIGERLLPMLAKGDWSPAWVRNRLDGIAPLVTGAYMVKTPAGMNKLEGVLWCIEEFLKLRLHERFIGGRCPSLEVATSLLAQAPYLGPFMAYEIASDLRWTRALRGATDIDSWANPGPGATRGLGWVLHRDAGWFNRNKAKDVLRMQVEMRSLLRQAIDCWPDAWRPWEMREVEHWLCEYDKWCRASYDGQALKRRYTCT